MGFTALFDLGISTAKYKASFDEQMKTYINRMENMQTVRMAEGAYQAFQGMLTSFAEQLKGANKGVYDAMDTCLWKNMIRRAFPTRGSRSACSGAAGVGFIL